jgi:hypothetical protein
VLAYLKENQFARVVDLGGSQDLWARKYIHLCVDEWDPMKWAERYPDTLEDGLIAKIEWMKGDLDDPVFWANFEFWDFDFAICSHVVEHLSNPLLLLSLLPEIAKEGIIMVPHKTTELRRGIHYENTRGMVPHRWICAFQEDLLRLYPKLGFIEALDFPWIDGYDPGELMVWWKGSIKYDIVSDKDIDFPDPQPAVTLYTERLKEGL